MKKSVFFASLLAGLLLVGCGKADNQDNSTNQSSTNTSTEQNSNENNSSDDTNDNTSTDSTVKPNNPTTTGAVFTLGDDIDESTFDPKNNGGKDVKGSKTLTSGNVELNMTECENVYADVYDYKGQCGIRIGTSKKAGSFTLTVPSDITTLEIEVSIYSTSSKQDKGKLTINDVEQEVPTFSNTGEYTKLTIDTSSTKVLKIATTASRALITSFTAK